MERKLQEINKIFHPIANYFFPLHSVISRDFFVVNCNNDWKSFSLKSIRYSTESTKNIQNLMISLYGSVFKFS